MKINFLVFLLISFAVSAQDQVDVLIRNGRIVDGTGNSWIYGDISIKDGKIMGSENSARFLPRELLMQQG